MSMFNFNFLRKSDTPETPKGDCGLGVFLLANGELNWKDKSTQYSEGYVRNAFVREACELYAVRLSSIDHIAYGKGGQDITDKDSPFLELMNNPNPKMTRHEMFHLIGLYLGIYGECFIFPHRKATGYDRLYVIDPALMTEMVNSLDLANPVQYWTCTKSVEGQSTFAPEELIHIKFPDPDMDKVRGLSRMVSCGKNIEMMNAIMEWNISTTRNGAKPSIGLKIPQRLTSIQRNDIKEEFRAAYQGARNAGNGIILDDGKDVVTLGMTAVEMDYQQGITNAAKQIAIAYAIPPEMMGDSANKTYSNAQEAARQIVVNTIRPLLDLVYSTIWMYFKDKPIASGIDEYTYDSEQLSDFMGVQTELYTALQSASYLTINDKRAKLGYEPIDNPLADDIMLTMADVPMSEYDSMDDPGKTDPEKNDLRVLLGE